MVAQALSMGKEPDANPHPLLMQTLPTLLNTLRNWTLRYWSIPCIVLTYTFRLTCLVHCPCLS